MTTVPHQYNAPLLCTLLAEHFFRALFFSVEHFSSLQSPFLLCRAYFCSAVFVYFAVYVCFLLFLCSAEYLSALPNIFLLCCVLFLFRVFSALPCHLNARQRRKCSAQKKNAQHRKKCSARNKILGRKEQRSARRKTLVIKEKCSAEKKSARQKRKEEQQCAQHRNIVFVATVS